MSKSPIRYLPTPQYCGACFNRALDDAAAKPEQHLVSVFCPHGGALLTGQITELDGERVVWCWSVSGPMTAEQALVGMQNAAESIGAKPIFQTQD